MDSSIPFFSIHTQLLDEHTALDPKRQRTILLNAFLRVSLIAAFALTLINIGFYLYNPNAQDLYFLLNDLAIIVALVGFAELNRRGHTHIVAVTSLVGMILAITFAFPVQDFERVFVVYTVPVLAASFLIRPRAAFAFGFFAITVYSLYAWYIGVFNHYVYISMIALIVVAAVAWMLVSLLNDTIARLGESEKKFRTFFQASSEGIMLIDHQGKIVEWNQAQAQICGIPSAQALNAFTWDVQWQTTPPEQRTQDFCEQTQATMRDIFRTEQWRHFNHTIETLIQTPTGERKTILQSIFPIKTKRGFYVGAISRDISERKHVEQALRTSEASFRLVFQNVGEGVGRVDGPGNFIIANPALEEIFGVAPGQLVGRNVTEFIPPDQRAKHTSQVARRHIGVRDNYDLTIERANGERREVTLTATPWFDTEGNYAGAFGVFRDITERKHIEKELATRTDRLTALYTLSRDLAETDTPDAIMERIVKCAVENTHVTFARLGLVQQEDLLIRAAYPVRTLPIDLGIGQHESLALYDPNWQIWESETPLILHADDPALTDAERAKLFLDLAQTVCLVPLRFGNRTIGILMLGEARSEAREPFDADKLQLARSIGEQSSSAIHRAILHEQTERRLEQLQSLHMVDMAITSSFDLNLTLDLLLTQARAQLGGQAASILLLNTATKMLTFRSGQGFHSRLIEQTRLRLGQDFAGRVALERKFLAVSDLAQNATPGVANFLPTLGNLRAYYAAPLISKGQVKGVIEIFNSTPLNIDRDWISLLETFATQTAIAIDNTELFDGLQRSNLELSAAYQATIEGWSRALDLRDHETEHHTQRVADLTVQLARAMNLSETEIPHIRYGALLHDIGKMGVPDSILLKVGALDPAEWAIMRRHPQFAYDMLSPINYLRNALDIAYCHHEKWDGSGYPRGLRGEAIPLTARLFAVVDVWDAITSDRPYRGGLPKQQALDYIRTNSGTHFDPAVVETFLNIVN